MQSPSIDEILRLVKLQLGAHNPNENSQLVEELGAESADVANIVAIIEEKYQINISEEEIAAIRTPQDVFDLINHHLNP